MKEVCMGWLKTFFVQSRPMKYNKSVDSNILHVSSKAHIHLIVKRNIVLSYVDSSKYLSHHLQYEMPKKQGLKLRI